MGMFGNTNTDKATPSKRTKSEKPKPLPKTEIPYRNLVLNLSVTFATFLIVETFILGTAPRF